MEHGRENAKTLLRKAAGDLVMLEVLIKADHVDDWGWAFHAQQCVEKSIKAVLANAMVKYPYIHDLEKLTKMLPGTFEAPPHSDAFEALSPFGSLTRYEGTEEPTTDEINGDLIVQQCTDVLRWAEEQTGLSSGRDA